MQRPDKTFRQQENRAERGGRITKLYSSLCGCKLFSNYTNRMVALLRSLQWVTSFLGELLGLQGADRQLANENSLVHPELETTENPYKLDTVFHLIEFTNSRSLETLRCWQHFPEVD